MHPQDKTGIRALTLVASGAIATVTLAQATPPYPLYSNGDAQDRSNPGLATGNTAGNGAMTPDDSQWSEVQGVSNTNANAVGGFSAHLTDPSGGYRFADDFRVRDPEGCAIDRVRLYAYQIGAESVQPTPCIFTVPAAERDVSLNPGLFNPTTPGGRQPPTLDYIDAIPFPNPGGGIQNPFDNINLRIWRGAPDSDASTVAWGDGRTNLFDDATRLKLYRIFNTTSSPAAPAPNAKRSIWQIELALPMIELQQGNYWLDWQFVPGGRNFEAFAPPVTVLNQRGLIGWNAKQFKACDAIWENAIDHGKPGNVQDVPQDLPFILVGKVVCEADLNDDSFVDIFDLLIFLSWWFSQNPLADIAPSPDDPDLNPGEEPAPIVDIFDLLQYLGIWFPSQGDCPLPDDRPDVHPFPVDDLDPKQIPDP